MKAKQFYLIILCLCLGTPASFAQGEGLSVKGRVVDEAGAKLAGVEITAKRISYNTKGYAASLANDPLLTNSSLADALRMLPGINLEEGSLFGFRREDRLGVCQSLSVRYRLAWGNKRARVNSNKVISTESMRMN